ncbi:MAG: MMPL family transporter [Myxococcales bacterium]|nr:MMPL family transporter [Myxococcales bacterium]
MRTSRLVALGSFAAIAALGALVLPRLEVQADITHFLPAGADRELAALSQAITSSDLNRTITLTLEAEDRDAAATAALTVAERLRARDDVAWVSAGPDEALQQAFYEVYFPRRFGFVDDDPEALDRAFSDEALRARAVRLREQLGSPTGTFVRRIAPEDPWLLFLDHVDRMRAALEGDLRVHAGAFVTGDDERYGVVLLTSAFSPFDVEASRALQAAIDEAAANVAPGVRVEQAGVHRIAAQSEATIRADIERVSIAGSLGVVLVLLLLFRSPRILALGALPLAGGMVVAVATVQLLFGAIHGLTLAFGATLIGVALDYVAHLFTHLHLAPAVTESVDAPTATARRIGPGLALGAATTVAGLLGLAWTSFPGIRQMAVFTSVGVTVALLLTRYALPPLLPSRPTPGRALRALGARAQVALEGLARRRRALLTLPILAAALAVSGGAQLTWQDDIRALNPLDATLAAEDERVRGRVARFDAGRFLVAIGDDVEEALRRNDALERALDAALDAGELARFRSLHPLLWSSALQRASHESIPADAFARTARAYEAEGFVMPPFEPFREALAAPFEPLTWEVLEASALGRLAASQRITLRTDEGAERVAILSFVQDVRDEDGLRARVEAIEGVRYFDQNAFMQDAYRGFRTSTLELVFVGLLFVLALVAARYRKPDLAFAAYVPALLAAGATLGLLGWLGLEANLLHVVTLLLVLSMGVDYGVFMVEAELHRRGALSAAESASVSVSASASASVSGSGSGSGSGSASVSASGSESASGSGSVSVSESESVSVSVSGSGSESESESASAPGSGSGSVSGSVSESGSGTATESLSGTGTGDDGPATVVSLIVAALSTAASFGVLAISTNPALRAMGLTAALGVLLALALAPTAWLLVRRSS